MKLPAFSKMGEKLVNRFFRQVDNVVWDLTSGKVGVITADDEIVTLDGEGDSAQVVNNPFGDFGVPIPAFAQSIPTAEIKQGDLIYNAKKVLGWIIGTPNLNPTGKAKATRTFKLLKPDGTRGEWSPAKISSMGLDLNGAMVLRSLVNMLGGTGGLGGLQGMLMPLMMAGAFAGDDENDDSRLNQMLPMMLMMQIGMGGMGGGTPTTGTMNPMAMMFMMPMMSKMMGGKHNPDRARSGYFD